MFVSAPWPEMELSLVQLNAMVRGEHSICWRAKQTIGSMFVLDFGKADSVSRRDGKTTTVGSLILAVRDVRWFVETRGRLVLNSEQDGAVIGRALPILLRGVGLLGVEVGTYLSFLFSGDIVLRCDRDDIYQNDGDEIAEFTFPDRQIVQCFADGRFLRLGAVRR